MKFEKLILFAKFLRLNICEAKFDPHKSAKYSINKVFFWKDIVQQEDDTTVEEQIINQIIIHYTKITRDFGLRRSPINRLLDS